MTAVQLTNWKCLFSLESPQESRHVRVIVTIEALKLNHAVQE